MDLSEYQYIVGYGIGQYYDYIKPYIPSQMLLDFLCDAKWEQFGGITVISPEELKALKSIFVVVFTGNPRNWHSISGMLDAMHVPYAHIDKILGGRETDIEDSISVHFIGSNNLITVSKGVSVGSLDFSAETMHYVPLEKEQK